MTAGDIEPVKESLLEKRLLLTGASGYVGGRLLARLEKRGLLVRCLARRPEFLADRVGPKTEVVEGDVLREDTLRPALKGVHTAYYLVHSMGSASREGFEAQDRLGAQNFARAAFDAAHRAPRPGRDAPRTARRRVAVAARLFARR